MDTSFKLWSWDDHFGSHPFFKFLMLAWPVVAFDHQSTCTNLPHPPFVHRWGATQDGNLGCGVNLISLTFRGDLKKNRPPLCVMNLTSQVSDGTLSKITYLGSVAFFAPNQEPFDDCFPLYISTFSSSSPMLRSKAGMPLKGQKWAIKLGLIEDDSSWAALFYKRVWAGFG